MNTLQCSKTIVSLQDSVKFGCDVLNSNHDVLHIPAIKPDSSLAAFAIGVEFGGRRVTAFDMSSQPALFSAGFFTLNCCASLVCGFLSFGESHTMALDKESVGLAPAERPRVRTSDVLSDNAKSFEDLLLSPALISSLKLSGFTQPSPVQQSAIPLGRIGSDLIVQAKSGTGKTVAFAVICLLRVKAAVSLPQVS